MTNRRKLKRAIHSLSAALIAECEAMRLYGKASEDDVQALTIDALRVYSNAICRISHVEPGVKPKAYFKDLKENLARQVEEISEHIVY